MPDNDATFGSAIFMNPGGPSGSGVTFVKDTSFFLRHYFDTPYKKHYEILSFDPRGVGRSTPMADCYPGCALARDASKLEARGNGPLTRACRL